MSTSATTVRAVLERVPATVVVIGTGLIGTSVALALRQHGTAVWLIDTDPASARLAADLGPARS